MNFKRCLSVFLLILCLVLSSFPRVTVQAELMDTSPNVENDQIPAVTEENNSPDPDLPGTSVDSSTSLEETDNLQSQIEAQAVDKIEMVISPGESLEFVNPTPAGRSVYTNGSVKNGILFDYAGYSANGKATYIDMDSATLTPVIPANGGTLIITALNSQVNLKVPADVTYSYSAEPALLRKTLGRGESYQISNAGVGDLRIMTDATSSNGKRLSYAIYKKDGSVKSSNLETYSNLSSSPNSGENIVVTGKSDLPVVIGTYYKNAVGQEIAEPAFESVQLHKGESYQFTNIGKLPDAIENDGTPNDKFDYVIYKPDGTELSRGTNTAVKPSFAPGNRIVITLRTDNPVTFGGPYRSFAGSPVNGDAISRITLSPGQSYLFRNNGSLTNPVNNNARLVGSLYDYVVYKADGSYYSKGFDSKITPNLPAGGYSIISVVSGPPVTFDYTDDFSAEPSNEPAFFRITLSKGESYEFTNISDYQRTLDSTASKDSRFDWVEYYPDGTQQGKQANTYNNPLVSKGNRIVVTTVTDVPVTFGVAYRLFSWRDKPGEAISHQLVRSGESYVFRNTGSKTISIANDAQATEGAYDYVSYTSEGMVENRGFNEKVRTISIPAQGFLIVTGQSDNPVTFNYTETITVELANHPAMTRVTLKQGQSYYYKNISDKVDYLYSDAIQNINDFSYVIIKPDGTVHSQDPVKFNIVIIPAGYTIKVTANYLHPTTFGAVFTSFLASSAPDSSYLEKTIKTNESYIFTNPDAKNQVLTKKSGTNSSLFDYVIYSSKGEVTKMGLNMDSNISIPAGSSAVVTAVSSEPVTLQYVKPVEAESITEPAFLKKLLKTGESITFANVSSYDAQLKTDASTNQYYDYTIIKADGSLFKEGVHSTGEYVVPAGGKITVKVSSTNPVSFAGPYRMFKFEDASEFVFEKLYENQPLNVSKDAGKNGYYLFTPAQTGKYRIAAKENNNSDQKPGITIFSDPKLQNALAASNSDEKVYGNDIVFIEADLLAGTKYYVKVQEKSGKALQLFLAAAILKVTPNATYDYSPAGRLTKVIFPTGDVILFEYDANGNLKKKTKQVYPF
ncbi:RHS repeat protein [Paenibacillus tuaregi]|uniref:RHS repeat protein n=1 Tax=Paenibacillus tuaregi TaxID=1816681 RepID=UPI000AA83EE1|nr:RHS repeat domain-containing protein [Paenibacillus tuaregi]